MARAFWFLEDGRCLNSRWTRMGYLLRLILEEIKEIDKAGEFYHFIKSITPDEDDEGNGYGGFIRTSTNELIDFNIDLREISPKYRKMFWDAAQRSLNKIKLANNPDDELGDYLLTRILDMHKRIERGESPNELNDLDNKTEEYSGKKIGPGWDS